MKLYSIIFLVAVSFLVPCGVAQGVQGDDKAQPVIEVPEENEVVFPYIAEIVGSNINIRSGSGRNYYSCGKISGPAQIVVVDQSYRWSQILPPPGSFSWIFKDYVKVAPDDSTVGIVTGDNVRVYAGSDTREPIRSDSLQVKLGKGQKVRILGPVENDYYKISPPEGATLWVYTEYAKFVRPADEIEISVSAKRNMREPKSIDLKPVVVPTKLPLKSEKLDEYKKLAKQVEAESAKPIDQQDYTDVKKALVQMRDDPAGEKASKYAKYLIKRIERCELAKQAGSELAEQQEQLQNALEQIARDRQEKLKNINDEGVYAVVGRISLSAVYDAQVELKRYLMTDSDGAVICYAQAVGDVKAEDFLGKRVGLIGMISPDAKSNLALVEFVKVIELKGK